MSNLRFLMLKTCPSSYYLIKREQFKEKIVDVTEFDYFYSMIGNRLKKNYKNNSKFFLGILFDIDNKTNK